MNSQTSICCIYEMYKKNKWKKKWKSINNYFLITQDVDKPADNILIILNHQIMALNSQLNRNEIPHWKLQ